MTAADADRLIAEVGALWPRFKLTADLALLWCRLLERFDAALVYAILPRVREARMTARDPDFDLLRALLADSQQRQETPSALCYFAGSGDPAAQELVRAYPGAISIASLTAWYAAVAHMLTVMGGIQRHCEHRRHGSEDPPLLCLPCFGVVPIRGTPTEKEAAIGGVRIVHRRFRALDPVGRATTDLRDDVLRACERAAATNAFDLNAPRTTTAPKVTPEIVQTNPEALFPNMIPF